MRAFHNTRYATMSGRRAPADRWRRRVCLPILLLLMVLCWAGLAAAVNGALIGWR